MSKREPNDQELDVLFAVPPSDSSVCKELRQAAKELVRVIVGSGKSGLEREQAILAVRQAVMWADAALVERPKRELQASKGNSELQLGDAGEPQRPIDSRFDVKDFEPGTPTVTESPSDVLAWADRFCQRLAEVSPAEPPG